MPEVQEVFRMTTEKIRPDTGFVDRQLAFQRKRSRNRKIGAVALAAVIALVGVVVVIRAMEHRGGIPAGQPSGGTVAPSADPVASLPGGSVAPGRYAFASGGSELDAAYRITIAVPDGYTSVGNAAVLKQGTGQTSVSTLAIDDVYTDPCGWQTSAMADAAQITSAEGLAATLASQEGLRISAPTTVTVDGFPATYLERRVPNAANIRSECDLAQFHLYRSPEFGDRWLDGDGQIQHLWIVDVDGIPFVIDATSQPDTSPEVKAELRQMVDSIHIDAT
jgi:hypothetical protein